MISRSSHRLIGCGLRQKSAEEIRFRQTHVLDLCLLTPSVLPASYQIKTAYSSCKSKLGHPIPALQARCETDSAGNVLRSMSPESSPSPIRYRVPLDCSRKASPSVLV